LNPDRLEAYPTLKGWKPSHAQRLEAYPTIGWLEAYPTIGWLEAYPTTKGCPMGCLLPVEC